MQDISTENYKILLKETIGDIKEKLFHVLKNFTIDNSF